MLDSLSINIAFASFIGNLNLNELREPHARSILEPIDHLLDYEVILVQRDIS